MKKKQEELHIDCLKMKDEVQAQVVKDREGLSPEEEVKQSLDRVLKNPKWGAWWRRHSKGRGTKRAS